MNIPSVTAERVGFTHRLRSALRNVGLRPSATVLARQFNMRAGESPVSVHAARKWLFDSSVPTQPRLIVLSEILGVTPQWLRFGEDIIVEKHEGSSVPIPHDVVLMVADIRKLDPASRQLVDTLVETMLKQQEA